MTIIIEIRFLNVKVLPTLVPGTHLERAVVAEIADWLGRSQGQPREARQRQHKAWAPIHPALKVVLDRRDDRLLRDVGLTPESVLGEVGYYWYEWARRRDPWSL